MLRENIKMCNESCSEISGPINDIIKHFKSRKSQFKKDGYTDIRVEFEDKWGYYDEHWIDVVYYGTKEMTDKEFLKYQKDWRRR